MNQQLDQHFLERWAAAYTLAKSIPGDNRFDMQSWGRKNKRSECGTSACLAGHAILHPWFMERGFVLEPLDPRTEAFALDPYWSNNGGQYEGFWGLNNLLNSPFGPETCLDLLGLGEDEDEETPALTPELVAQAVYKWMTMHWGAEATDAAIAASDVTYKAAYVHQNAPWNKEAP